MTYDYDGNPELGHLTGVRAGRARAEAHNIGSLKLEYGTLVPMRCMNSDKHFKSGLHRRSALCMILPTAADWVKPFSGD